MKGFAIYVERSIAKRLPASLRRDSNAVVLGIAVVVLMCTFLAAPLPASQAEAVQESSTPVQSDADDDGVADREDRCPGTPRGARPLSSGCSAVEVVRQPETILRPLLAGLKERKASLDDRRAFAEVAQHLGEGISLIESSATQLRKGQVCLAETTYGGAAEELRLAQSSMAGVVNNQTTDLLRDRRPGGDVHSAEMSVAFLRLMEFQLGEAVGSALNARAVFAQMCGAVTGNLATRGRVVETDDAAGLIRLDNGKVLALAADFYPTPVYEGGVVSASGLAFNDGTGVATGINGYLGKNLGDFFSKCLDLRVAPVQRLPPHFAGPYTLHYTKAYENASGVLQLEQGMHLGVKKVGCPNSTSYGETLRYHMQIDVEQGSNKETIATDLEDGDSPASFILNNGPATVHTTVFRESCKQFANGMDICSATEKLGEQSYPIYVRARGSYSTAVYNRTVFEVTDNGISGDFDTATVVVMDLNFIEPGTNPTFMAEGYLVSNGVSTRPQVVNVAQGQAFAVYEDDFYDPDLILFQDELTGTEGPSGLRWPRVVGTRNGKEFWYYSKLPKLIRDRVDQCPSPEDSYYKLPFVGGWPTWIVNNGNADDPVNAHGAGQAFAWDFNADSYTDIHAARGGVVSWVVEDEYLNAKDYPLDYKGIGNYIHVKHEDGTYAVYFHLVQDGSLVSVGDKVHRGDHIGEVGNTGNSSAPHLHFEVVQGLGYDSDGKLIGAASLPSRFEAKVGEGLYGFPYSLKTCYIPRVFDKVLSTQ